MWYTFLFMIKTTSTIQWNSVGLIKYFILIDIYYYQVVLRLRKKSKFIYNFNSFFFLFQVTFFSLFVKNLTKL